MAEVKPSTSGGEDAVELVGEVSCSGADGPTYYPLSVPPAFVAKSPSFLTWMWIQILTACSRVWRARGGGLVKPRMLGLASGPQHSLEDSESEVLSRIEASKSTWSEVPADDNHDSVSVPRPCQLSVWEELKASKPYFFSDDLLDTVELGRLIGEGGQAQIFEANSEGFEHGFVCKIFKLDAGFSLADLKRHWPHSMRKGGEDCFVFETDFSNPTSKRCCMFGATMLKDGRFAFLMPRYRGDLRTLIDLKVEDNIHPWEFDLLCRNGRQRPPFSFHDSIWIMEQIAKGMQRLHAEGVLHRDLKAANVLIGAVGVDLLFCDVADYECAMFVQGTGFWRAPEVLQELQKNEEDRNGEMWTEKVDVYSFGMTCYEILTGQIPFDGYTKSKWADVIEGERLILPDYVFPKLRELVEACWHAQPSQRPSFGIILKELRSFRKEQLGIR